jgi:hypothetical protein
MVSVPEPVISTDAVGDWDGGLPKDIYHRLFKSFRDCGPFDNIEVVRSLFVSYPLSLWQDRVPDDAYDIVSRVERIINTFHNKFSVNDDNALVCLAEALRDRLREGTMCHKQLDDVAKQLEAQLYIN